MRVDIPGERPVCFEGISLADEIKFLSEGSVLSLVSAPSKTLFLDLKYSWGLERSAPAVDVVKAIDEVAAAIDRHEAAIEEHLAVACEIQSPPEVIRAWKQGLLQMKELSERRLIVRWFTPPTPEEVGRNFRKAENTYRLSTKVRARLPQDTIPDESSSDQTKIDFVHSVTAALSQE